MPAREAFQQLEAIRPRLPQPPRRGEALFAPNLEAIAADFEVFCFDAFGVLNVGQNAIPGVAEVIKRLRAQEKRVFVLSNAAAYEKTRVWQRFQRLGYDFTPEEIICSRDALLRFAPLNTQQRYGVINVREGQQDLSAYHGVWQDEADFLAADAFLFLSSLAWDAARQKTWLEALQQYPRPIYVGNPDLLAPQGDNSSIEAGFYTLLLPEALFAHTRLYGKPFPEIFHVLFERLPPNTDKKRILMLGDTLHTDILGALNIGISSALILNHGFLKGLNAEHYMLESGIYPDYVLPCVAKT